MLPFKILALSLVALSSVQGDTQPLQFGTGTWETSNPNHIVVPSGRGMPFPNPTNIEDPNTPSDPNNPSSIPSNCPTVAQTPGSWNSGSGSPSATTPGKAQIAWCSPLPAKDSNATEPVVAWFTQIQPGDTAPTPTNATAAANGTETEEATAKKTPATKELGSCTPISLDMNEGGGEPQKPGQIGWFIPIPKPDEAAANNSSGDDNTPGGNVTLGWCTPLADSGDATKAQLGDCKPYEPASSDTGSGSTTTTTTPKPDAKKEGDEAKELLSWYTPYKYDPEAKGSVVAYFVPVVASVPPPKEPIDKETKAPEAGGGGGGEAAPPKEA